MSGFYRPQHHTQTRKQLHPCRIRDPDGGCHVNATEESSTNQDIKQDVFIRKEAADRIIALAATRFLEGKKLNQARKTRRLEELPSRSDDLQRYNEQELMPALRGHLRAGAEHSADPPNSTSSTQSDDSSVANHGLQDVTYPDTGRHRRSKHMRHLQKMESKGTQSKHVGDAQKSRHHSRSYFDGPFKKIVVCDNSCPTARNGKCQDGRFARGEVRIFSPA